MSEESTENKPKAESVGQIIVKAREARGMEREDLARAVHLGVDFLAAIEEGRWQDLPGDTYARSYIISLCSELGLQKSEMLEKYASDAHRDRIDSLAGAEPFRQPDFKTDPVAANQREIARQVREAVARVADAGGKGAAYQAAGNQSADADPACG